MPQILDSIFFKLNWLVSRSNLYKYAFLKAIILLLIFYINIFVKYTKSIIFFNLSYFLHISWHLESFSSNRAQCTLVKFTEHEFKLLSNRCQMLRIHRITLNLVLKKNTVKYLKPLFWLQRYLSLQWPQPTTILICSWTDGEPT